MSPYPMYLYYVYAVVKCILLIAVLVVLVLVVEEECLTAGMHHVLYRTRQRDRRVCRHHPALPHEGKLEQFVDCPLDATTWSTE
jgi:hypothetical protein